jgi:hypothetical protein
MPKENIAQTPWHVGDLVRYKGGMGSVFTARLTKRPEVIQGFWEARIEKIKRQGGNLSSDDKPGTKCFLYEDSAYCTKVAHAKLDAEKRDSVIQQLESDVVTLMNERDELKRWKNLQLNLRSRNQELWELAFERGKTIKNLQAKVVEQATDLQRLSDRLARSESANWLASYEGLKRDLDREIKNGRQRVDHWQEKLVKAEADRDTFKNQAYVENAKLSAVRKLVQDLEKQVGFDLNPKLYHDQDTLINKLGVYESAVASIKRGYATKKVLDRLKEALGGEVGPNVTTTFKFAEPKTRYWTFGAVAPLTVYRRRDGVSEYWNGPAGHWVLCSARPDLQSGFVEISASDLPKGVTP